MQNLATILTLTLSIGGKRRTAYRYGPRGHRKQPNSYSRVGLELPLSELRETPVLPGPGVVARRMSNVSPGRNEDKEGSDRWESSVLEETQSKKRKLFRWVVCYLVFLCRVSVVLLTVSALGESQL